ncbi:MAG: DUF2314 domain-containing protein [Rhizobacter sp.]
MRKLVFIALLLPAGLSAQSLTERAEKDDLVFMKDEEPAMRRAFQVARETLDDFLKLASEPRPGQALFALKVAIADGKKTEYFWVNKFEAKGGGKFEGTISNEPRMVKTVALGQRYTLSRAQIVDWTYADKTERPLVGNFTLCALLTKESKEEAEATKRRFNLDCSKVTG